MTKGAGHGGYSAHASLTWTAMSTLPIHFKLAKPGHSTRKVSFEENPSWMLLAHKAGVCGPRARMQATELYDFERMESMLADMEPWWAPGTASGYHAITWGFLPG